MQKKFLTAMAALLSVALFFMGCPADNGEEEEPNLSGSIVISATSGGTAATSATTGATLYAVYSGGTETVAYQWNKDGAVISSGGTGASYMPATAGSYTVTVSASGYQSKTSAPVTVTGGGGTLAEAKGKLTLTGFNEFNGKYVYPVLITSSGKTLTGINGADYSAGNPIISMVPISSGTAEVPLYTMNPAETSVSNAFVPYEGSETFQTVSIMIVNDADGKVTSSEVTSFTTNYAAMIINNSSNTSFTPSTTNGSITISHSDTSGSSNNTVKYILVVNPNSAGS